MEQHNELQCVFLATPISQLSIHFLTLSMHLYNYFISECFLRTFDLTLACSSRSCLVSYSYYIIHSVSSELPFPRIPVDGSLICLFYQLTLMHGLILSGYLQDNIIQAFTPCLCTSDMPLYLGAFPFWHEELSWAYLVFFIVFRKSLKPCHPCLEQVT